ncbi:hypothetical protein Dsin_017543 [Dipteronia sinensis]|nr:hypothetical protein Dsin_017543 [Dipteronia sinensis]
MYLNYMNPLWLYRIVNQRNQNLLVLDVGSRFVGLAILDVATGESFPVPRVLHEVNLPLTPVQHVLGDQADWIVNFHVKSYDINPVAPVQLIMPLDMKASSIRIILNMVAAHFNVGGFLVGMSADRRFYPSRPENFGFISKFLSKLDNDAGLLPRNFTLVDEMFSTKQAENLVALNFPELSPEHFVDIFPEVIGFYHTGDAIMEDLNNFAKGLVDTYSALLFSQAFIKNCVSGKLESGEKNMLKAYLMRNFAANLGYIGDGDFDTGHEHW